MAYTNDTKPSSATYTNDTKPTTSVGELWSTITTTWETETRKWFELASGNVYTNDVKPS